MTSNNSLFFPKYFSKKAIIGFSIVLAMCLLLFINKILPFQWIIFGFVEVVGFFLFANLLTKRWANLSVKVFQKRLLWTSFGLRLIWVIFSFFYFTWMTGQPFEYETGDAKGYYGESQWLGGLLRTGKFDDYLKYIGLNYADMGYPMYLGILNYLVGGEIIIPRLIKAILGAYTCLLMYKLARNNFDESVGRIAGILGMLLPNLIYYCGLHVKETEMVFLTVSFVYVADKMLREKQFSLNVILLVFSTGAAMFLFRTVLAACLVASILVTVFFMSKRASSFSKRTGVLLMTTFATILIFSTSLRDNINEYIQASDQNLTSQMENFSTTNNANKLSKYGTRSIFLPFMLMAPFPTLVNTAQPNPMMLGGAFFTRNVYVFFVFIAFIGLYKRKQLRNHILLLSILFSYLFVLASSGFALSERFHLPIVPILLIFASYGITQLNVKNKKYYIPYLVMIAVIVIGWNWFKLAGRV